jgi:hypothetical protein
MQQAEGQQVKVVRRKSPTGRKQERVVPASAGGDREDVPC